jgi:pimeloyl-ACP methyl ester carboxylesterase
MLMATRSQAPKPEAPEPVADNENLSPPHWGLLALEFRAPWEFAAVLPAAPALARAPRGDGHTVLVFPGLGAADGTTYPLRGYLEALGYSTQGWEQGFNFGPRAGVLERAKEQIAREHQRTGEKISLIGWSLGGVYARELAKELPHAVRCVVTLGTPFAAGPKSTNAWRVFELVSGRKIEREREKFDLPTAPPVPTTSIYSRTDGVVAWQGSVQAPCPNNPHTENIEVLASHIGIGLNPSAWWAVAHRLAQPIGQWQPFSSYQPKIRALHGLIYPDPARS